MDITLLELTILGLASFRLTRLIVFDQITAFIREIFIEEIEQKTESGETEIYLVPKKGLIRAFFGKLLSCYWCTGIWSSAIIYGFYVIAPSVFIPILIIFAVSGLAAIIETLIQLWL